MGESEREESKREKRDQTGNKVRYSKTLLSDWELFYDVIFPKCSGGERAVAAEDDALETCG